MPGFKRCHTQKKLMVEQCYWFCQGLNIIGVKLHTVCPRNLYSFDIVSQYIKIVNTVYNTLGAQNNLLHGFLVLLAVGAPAVLVQHVHRHPRHVGPKQDWKFDNFKIKRYSS